MAALNRDIPKAFAPLIKPSRYKGIHGGRGCLHGDTLIDTPDGQVKISEFTGGRVFCATGLAFAGKPVKYRPENLYEVELSNGVKITATAKHRFLTQRGWIELSSLGDQDYLASREPYPTPIEPSQQRIFEPYHQQTSSGIYRKEFLEDVHHCLQTILNYLCHCFEGHRLYDEQPHLDAETYLDAVQILAYGQQHNFHISTHTDGQEFENKNTLSQSLHHHSSQAFPLLAEEKGCEALENYSAENISARLLELCKLSLQSQQNNNHSELIQELASSFLGFYSLINQDESFQTISNMLSGDVDDDSYCNLYNSCNHNLHYIAIESITYHSHDVFYDFFVPVFNNYLTSGIVNHNSGKSHDRAEALIAFSAIAKVDAVCVREIQKSLSQSVKKLLEIKIEALKVGHLFDVQESVIKSIHGGKIIFQGMQNHTADSIKSLEGFDVAWVEEAQSLSQRSLDLLRPTIRKPGSEIWFTWNPDKDTDPIDAFLRCDNPPPDAIVVQANYNDNPWFPDVLKAEMEYDRERDHDKYAHVWLGQYQQNSEARVFKNWTVKEFDSPANANYYLGADWGFSVDPSVLVRCRIDGRQLFIDHEAYMVGCEIEALPMLFDRVPDSRKWFITADSARPETISYMRRNGYPRINPAIKGARSIEEGIEFLKNYDIVVHPRCVETINELTNYSYKIDPLTQAVLPVLADKDNHVLDSLRYALEGARRAIGAMKKTPPARIYQLHDAGAGY